MQYAYSPFFHFPAKWKVIRSVRARAFFAASVRFVARTQRPQRESCADLFEAVANRISVWQLFVYKRKVLHFYALDVLYYDVQWTKYISVDIGIRVVVLSKHLFHNNKYFIRYFYYKLWEEAQRQPQPQHRQYLGASAKGQTKCFYPMNWRFIKTKRNGELTELCDKNPKRKRMSLAPLNIISSAQWVKRFRNSTEHQASRPLLPWDTHLIVQCSVAYRSAMVATTSTRFVCVFQWLSVYFLKDYVRLFSFSSSEKIYISRALVAIRI